MSIPLDKQLSRRDIVGGIGAGLATLAATTWGGLRPEPDPCRMGVVRDSRSLRAARSDPRDCVPNLAATLGRATASPE
jgi:hypothetical protein